MVCRNVLKDEAEDKTVSILKQYCVFRAAVKCTLCVYVTHSAAYRFLWEVFTCRIRGCMQLSHIPVFDAVVVPTLSFSFLLAPLLALFYQDT